MPRKYTGRSKARKRAIDILFEADQRGFGANPLRVAELTKKRQIISAAQTELPAYALTILEGVCAHLPQIDELIGTYAKNWSMARLAGVDLAILRVGIWELLYNDDVPDGTVLQQATTIAQILSTDNSPRFVNGILGKIEEIKPSLAVHSTSSGGVPTGQSDLTNISKDTDESAVNYTNEAAISGDIYTDSYSDDDDWVAELDNLEGFENIPLPPPPGMEIPSVSAQ